MSRHSRAGWFGVAGWAAGMASPSWMWTWAWCAFGASENYSNNYLKEIIAIAKKLFQYENRIRVYVCVRERVEKKESSRESPGERGRQR